MAWGRYGTGVLSAEAAHPVAVTPNATRQTRKKDRIRTYLFVTRIVRLLPDPGPSDSRLQY